MKRNNKWPRRWTAPALKMLLVAGAISFQPWSLSAQGVSEDGDLNEALITTAAPGMSRPVSLTSERRTGTPNGSEVVVLEWQLAIACEKWFQATRDARDAALDLADVKGKSSPQAPGFQRAIDRAENGLECTRKVEAHWAREVERLRGRVQSAVEALRASSSAGTGRNRSDAREYGLAKGDGASGGIGSRGGSETLAPRAAPASVAPARLEMTVYEAHVPANRIAELDVAELGRQATDQELRQVLGTLGRADVLYSIGQTVNLLISRWQRLHFWPQKTTALVPYSPESWLSLPLPGAAGTHLP